MCLTFAVYSFQVTLDPLQSWQFTETESTLELYYIPVVDFFIKSLHFFGKFIAKKTNLENNTPAFYRDYIFQSKPRKRWGPTPHDACVKEQNVTFFWCFL